MIKEPKRMREEPSVLGASLAAVRDEQPSDERLAALAARLSAAGAAVDFRPAAKLGSPAETAAPAPALARATPWGRRALALSLLALAGAGLVTWAAAERGHPTAPPDAMERVATTRPTTSSTPSVVTAAPPSDAIPAPLAAPRTRDARSSADERGDGIPQAGSPGPSAFPAPEPPVGPSTTARQELVKPAPKASATANGATEREPRTARSPASRPATTASETNPGAPLTEGNVVTSELEFLKRARSALAADPAQAFALTERCRAQYPSGDLAQEREYIAISALVRVGRSSEATSRAALFRMHYPSSAYLPRLARLLGEP